MLSKKLRMIFKRLKKDSKTQWLFLTKIEVNSLKTKSKIQIQNSKVLNMKNKCSKNKFQEEGDS